MKNQYIHRDRYIDLLNDLKRDEITFLIGPRQSGKTTLLKKLLKELQGRGEQTLFLSLDFELDRVHFSSQQNLLNRIELEFGKERGYLFIDEIQRKEDAGLFLKGIYDLNLPVKFIVSGSGSVDLKAKIRESLLGRKRVHELYPVSLKEFVNFKSDYRYRDNLPEYFSTELQRLDNYLLEYMNFGGYPRVILESEFKEKVRTIDEIYKGYIEKDIALFLKVEKVDAYAMLMKILSDCAGKLINYSELSTTLGISLPTLKNYLWYGEKTFILHRVTPFFRNIRKEIGKSPVIYFSDLGLKNWTLNIFGSLSRPEDLGFVFQNLIYMILKEKLRYTSAAIHFWRTKSGAELDFVVDSGRDVFPIEVKYQSLSRTRLPRSFGSFIEKYKPRKGFVVNRNLREKITHKGCEITFLTVWDLLLTDFIPDLSSS